MSIIQVSWHLVKVFNCVKEHRAPKNNLIPEGWVTAKDVVSETMVAPRTARHHLGNLFDIGLFERKETFGGFLYRFTLPPYSPEASSLMQEIEAVSKVITAT